MAAKVCVAKSKVAKAELKLEQANVDRDNASAACELARFDSIHALAVLDSVALDSDRDNAIDLWEKAYVVWIKAIRRLSKATAKRNRLERKLAELK